MSTSPPVVSRLVVGIPTYCRPEQIAAGLPMVLAEVRAVNEDPHTLIRARVVVIDNDAAGSAATTVDELNAAEVHYVVEPVPGISAARNRALDEAAGDDLLVFIDDDERPRPGWLGALVTTWRETGATGVMGRVVSHLADDLDPWVAAGDFFWRPRMPTGTEIEVAATGNLLLDLRQVRAAGIRFDQRFGLSGGEDTLFSRQLVRSGARLVWCDESVTDDYVVTERLNRRWLVNRAWSHGNTFSAVELALAEGKAARQRLRLRLVARAALRVVGGTTRWLAGVGLRSQRHQARGSRTALRGAGMFAGALGHVYQEYARSGDVRPSAPDGA